MGHHTTVPFWVVTDHMKFAHVWSSFEDHGRWSCVDQPKNQTDHFFKWTKPWWHFSREKMASHSQKKIQPTKNKSPVPFGTKRVADRFSKTSADPNTPNDMLQHFYNRAEMLSEVATHLGSDWVDAISCLKKRWGICHFAMLVFNKGGMLNVGICRTPMLKLELFFWGLEYSPKLGRLPGWKDNTVFEVRHPVFLAKKQRQSCRFSDVPMVGSHPKDMEVLRETCWPYCGAPVIHTFVSVWGCGMRCDIQNSHGNWVIFWWSMFVPTTLPWKSTI